MSACGSFPTRAAVLGEALDGLDEEGLEVHAAASGLLLLGRQELREARHVLAAARERREGTLVVAAVEGVELEEGGDLEVCTAEARRCERTRAARAGGGMRACRVWAPAGMRALRV